VLLAEGQAYRLWSWTGVAALDVEARDAQGNWWPFTRKGGETGWYGYNLQNAGEVRSSAAKLHLTEEQRAGVGVKVAACELEPGVRHRAEYMAGPSFCIVVTELMAQQQPEGAGIIRLAPRFDIDIKRFTCYALRNGRGILHTGTIQALAARPAYVGVGTWGGPGCSLADLDPQRPYLAFFRPSGGPLLAFIYPHTRTLWIGGRHFLQLWEKDANYFYSGMFDRGHFNETTAFVIYARADGDLEAFEAELPTVLQRVDELAASGAVKLPALAAAHEMQQRMAALRSSLSPADTIDEGHWLWTWKRYYAVRAAERVLTEGNPLAAKALVDWVE